MKTYITAKLGLTAITTAITTYTVRRPCIVCELSDGGQLTIPMRGYLRTWSACVVRRIPVGRSADYPWPRFDEEILKAAII